MSLLLLLCEPLAPGSNTAPLSKIASATGVVPNPGTTTITVPAGVTSSHLCVLVMADGNSFSDGNNPVPSGGGTWTHQAANPAAGNNMAWNVWTTPSSPAAGATIALTGANNASEYWAVWYDTGGQDIAVVGTPGGRGGSSTADVAIPGVTTTVNGQYGIVVSSERTTAAGTVINSWSPSAPVMDAFFEDNATGVSTFIGHFPQVTAGATGNYTATYNSASGNGVGMILVPAAVVPVTAQTWTSALSATAGASASLTSSQSESATLAATAGASASLTSSQSESATLAATAGASASLTSSQTATKALTATAGASVSLGSSQAVQGTLGATAGASASLGTSHSLSSAVSATGGASASVTSSQTASKALAATADAPASIGAGTSASMPVAATALGSASLASSQTVIKALAATAGASASLASSQTVIKALAATAGASASASATSSAPPISALSATASATASLQAQTYAPFATLVDDFSTSANWELFGGTITGGQAVIPSNSTNRSIRTLVPYSLVGSSIAVQVAAQAKPLTGGYRETFVRLESVTSNGGHLTFELENGVLGAYVRAPGSFDLVPQRVGGVAAADGMWLRFRESDGTVFWDTSPDGFTWSEFVSWVADFPVGWLYATLSTGAETDDASSPAIFDNVNVFPVVTMGAVSATAAATVSLGTSRSATAPLKATASALPGVLNAGNSALAATAGASASVAGAGAYQRALTATGKASATATGFGGPPGLNATARALMTLSFGLKRLPIHTVTKAALDVGRAVAVVALHWEPISAKLESPQTRATLDPHHHRARAALTSITAAATLDGNNALSARLVSEPLSATLMQT